MELTPYQQELAERIAQSLETIAESLRQGDYTVRRTPEQIAKVLELAEESRAPNGAFYERYEEGIHDFAMWLFGKTNEPPLED